MRRMRSRRNTRRGFNKSVQINGPEEEKELTERKEDRRETEDNRNLTPTQAQDNYRDSYSRRGHYC